MKLNKFHIFLILLGSLMMCCLGFSALEGMENKTPKSTNYQDSHNLAHGSNNEPFHNSATLEFSTTEQQVQDSVPASKMKAIPKNQIPQGDEDLYILKSQIVPPVCPKCPDVKKCDTTKDCAPCPAPQRCPDRPFECKMVPKYSDPRVSSHLPRAVLNDFSTFAK